jgi:hypothetical protein
VYTNIIDRFPFSTPFTTATDIADLSIVKIFSAGQSSLTDGYSSGGFTTPLTYSNVVDRFPFSTPFTTSTDIGDISVARFGVSGQQD